jgi:replicative DNA helicase
MSEEAENLPPVPWSNEAEQAVLGALLLDNSAWDRVADLLEARHFFSGEHRLIWTAIGTLIMSGKPADVVTVHVQLQASRQNEAKLIEMAYLLAVSGSIPSSSSIRHYGEIVIERWQQRVLRIAADRAQEIANSDGPAVEKIERIQAGFAQLERQHVRDVPRRMQDIVVERLDHITALGEGTVENGWTTGLKKLDALLRGGFKPGRVYLLGGRPGMGKSALALWSTLHGALDHDVCGGYLSQEMPDSEVGERGLSITGNLSYTNIQTGKLTDAEWAKLSTAAEKLAQIDFHIDAQAGLTFNDIRIKARYIKGLKVLVLDYVQLCKGTGEGEANRNGELELISRGLKQLAKDMGIAILALSALGRKVDERAFKRPIMSDFKDCGALEGDADVLMTLFPLRAMDSRGAKIMGLEILKSRQGPTGLIAVDFWGDFMDWEESEYEAEDLLRPDKKNKVGDI